MAAYACTGAFFFESFHRAYFPENRWYDFHTGEEYSSGWKKLNAPLNHINIHLAGGKIIPTQDVAQTTMDSRTKPLGLIVSLDTQKSAKGQIYWDEGDSLNPLDTGR